MLHAPSALTLRADVAAPQLDPQAPAPELYEQVVHWYRECLLSDAGIPAHEFLLGRALQHERLIDHFEIGFADRALPQSLPAPKLKAGKLIRARLQQLGVYRESGHALYSGSLTFPLRNTAGELVDIYGRKAGKSLVAGTSLHTYLPAEKRPHGEELTVQSLPIFNVQLLGTAPTLVLTDSPLNALAAFVAGLEHVTCVLHDRSLNESFVQLMIERHIHRVVLTFRNTEHGVTASEAAAAQLKAAGLQVTATQLPATCDAADVLQQHGAEQLAALVQAASERQVLVVAGQVAITPAEPTPDAKPPASAAPPSPTPTPPPSSDQADLLLAYDDRHYRVRGLAENNSPLRLKINLKVTRDNLFHVNLLDLYSAAQRKAFMRDAASEILVPEELIKQDLGHILRTLEDLQAQQLAARLAPATPPPIVVSDAERQSALELLQDPQLTQRVLSDMQLMGLVGEEANKLLCYLACVSRKLPRPLAILVQSSSGAGKSSLMDATLALMPDEEQIRYSAMTGQSLYYMGGGPAGAQKLKHKILAIAEEQGIAEASYALKLLQSDGKLKIASAGKDEATGRQTTQDYEVEGPVMMFLTTTRQQPDPELQNRCLTLRVNETPEQTAAIHALQRAEYAGTAGELTEQRKQVRQLHANAQRLLEPYSIVIPQVEQLTFRQDQTRLRREHAKYLTLIAASALLHQYQRERIERADGTRQLIATLDDIRLAGRLLGEVVGQSLSALLPQTRQLLVLIDHWVSEQVRAGQAAGRVLARSQVRFKQRELREALGWGDFQLREHLARLVELEFVLVYRTGRGNERHYELLYDGQGRSGAPFCLGLAEVNELR